MFYRRLFLPVVAALGALWAHPAQAQTRNYIALGDSYALGYTTPSAPASNGDQGYVSLFANALATRLGGVRPTVTNLAVSGETSTSFFSGTPTNLVGPPFPDGLVDAPLREPARNTNYLGTSSSQSALLQGRLSTIRSAGQTVDFVTVQIGGNDILGVLGQTAFQSLGATQAGQLQQQQILQNRFLNLQTQYTTLLTALTNPTTGVPNAQIILVGYADPFAGLGVNNPLSGGTPNNPLSTQLTLQANGLISGLAQAFGVRYVDIYTPFKGNETQYTYIADPNASLPGGTPNFHPNALGYSVIANRINAVSAAPEPSDLGLLSIVLAPSAMILVRRRMKLKTA